MAMTRPVAIVVLGPSGMETARRAAAALPGATVHGLARRVADADTPFDDTTGHIRGLFEGGYAIVGVCAAGILIRALAPMLDDKRDEPPVIALAEDGSAVVPLLGGHHGANDVARKLGDALGVAPAITTAGDLRFGVALDDPPPDWRLANPEHVKPFMAEMLAGKTVRIVGDAPWLTEAGIESDLAGELQITASPSDLGGNEKHLVYHPRSIAIGVGCERGVTAEELVTLVDDAMYPAALSKDAVAGIFSLDLKADEPALHDLAAAYRVPVRFFDAATLEAETPRLKNPSDVVFRAVGCHGVAEAAALAASGADGRLYVPKRKSRRATCAIAGAPGPIDALTIGRSRSWLGIVGTGPGAAEWLTPEAASMLDRATDVVGYGLYLDLVADRIAGKTRHEYPLGEEETRVRAALDLAAEGREVALVSSGDPGIYAMATLAYELIDREDRADWRRIEVMTAPGISALQAAAARAGAPLGHDFCTISLSDLMTPWNVIEKRVKAAAEGDFVLAFYNPVSRRRDWQLARAREILLEHRSKTTPVIIARNLGRDGEEVRLTTLNALDPKTIDMLTVVLVGSSETRAVERADGRAWVYTPRGYGEAAKTGEAS
jgi:cobalt-precorrin 5A hydrolase/precorrin-3B C17-methyltransferase